MLARAVGRPQVCLPPCCCRLCGHPPPQELGWREIKDRYVRPTYLPASFALGALTIGLRLGAANYTFTDSVSGTYRLTVLTHDS